MVSSAVKRLQIQGEVWDSCCGLYPEMTLVRMSVFMIAAYRLYRRDKMIRLFQNTG